MRRGLPPIDEKPVRAAPPLRPEQYRVAVFGRPRAPWRATTQEAKLDAIKLGLASWDDSRREHFLAVPVDIERRIAPQ
jgi:hypothetical protein